MATKSASVPNVLVVDSNERLGRWSDSVQDERVKAVITSDPDFVKGILEEVSRSGRRFAGAIVGSGIEGWQGMLELLGEECVTVFVGSVGDLAAAEMHYHAITFDERFLTNSTFRAIVRAALGKTAEAERTWHSWNDKN